MPPLGNLYDMPVYADASFAKNEEITFNAGTHRELVRMTWADLMRLLNPQIVDLSRHPAIAAA